MILIFDWIIQNLQLDKYLVLYEIWFMQTAHDLKKLYEEDENPREIASDETGLPHSNFPEEPHFTFEQVMDESYL